MCGAVKLTDLCENDWGKVAIFGLYRYGIKNVKSTIPTKYKQTLLERQKCSTVKVGILQSVRGVKRYN